MLSNRSLKHQLGRDKGNTTRGAARCPECATGRLTLSMEKARGYCTDCKTRREREVTHGVEVRVMDDCCPHCYADWRERCDCEGR